MKITSETNLVKTVFSVALIGLGNVGFGQYLSKRENQILDHYSAIKSQQNLNLVVCCDIRKPSGVQEPFVSDVNEISSLNVDLLVISAPTETHLSVLETFLKKNSAKIILVEKPCTNSIQEINRLIELLVGFADTEVLVNYHRNYNHVFIDTFGDESLGKLQCGIVHYSNGALNNASHALGLILPHIGNVTTVKVLSRSQDKKFQDFDFVLENFEGSKVVFLATNENFYSNFRLELDFEHGVVSYDSAIGEILTRRSIADPVFIDRRNLEPVGHTVTTNESMSFQYVYNFLVAKLEHVNVNPEIGVDMNFAKKIQEIFDEIKNFQL